MRSLLSILVLFSTSIFGQSITSTITSVNGGYTLTCLNTSLNLTVSASTTNSYQSTWHTSQSTSFSGNNVTISNPDTYTVITKDLISNDSVSNILVIYQDTLKPKVKRDTIYFHCGSVPGAQFDYTTTIAVNFLMPCPTCTYNWVNHNGGFLTPTNVANGIIIFLGSYSCNVTNTVNGCSTTFVMDVLCNVGLNESSNSKSFINIFPNPVNDKLNIIKAINSPIESINVTNVLGQNAIEVKHPVIQDELDLSALPTGVYFLNIKFSEQIKTFKIIKR